MNKNKRCRPIIWEFHYHWRICYEGKFYSQHNLLPTPILQHKDEPILSKHSRTSASVCIVPLTPHTINPVKALLLILMSPPVPAYTSFPCASSTTMLEAVTTLWKVSLLTNRALFKKLKRHLSWTDLIKQLMLRDHWYSSRIVSNSFQEKYFFNVSLGYSRG